MGTNEERFLHAEYNAKLKKVKDELLMAKAAPSIRVEGDDGQAEEISASEIMAARRQHTETLKENGALKCQLEDLTAKMNSGPNLQPQPVQGGAISQELESRFEQLQDCLRRAFPDQHGNLGQQQAFHQQLVQSQQNCSEIEKQLAGTHEACKEWYQQHLCMVKKHVEAVEGLQE